MNEFFKEKILIWGAGKQSELLYELLRVEGLLSNVVGIIDKAEEKWGNDWHGFIVSSPNLLDSVLYDRVVISVWNWHSIFFELSNHYGIDSNKIDNCAFIMRQRMLSFYHDLKQIPEDMQVPLDHIKKYPLDFINYDYVYDYYKRPIEIIDENNTGCYVAILFGRRMYLPKSKLNTEEKARNYVRSLMAEQDEHSPHRYLSKDFELSDGACILDLGAAEGVFTLLNIDKISKAYLVESDKEWIKALEFTFFDYKDKVDIIHGFVSDKDNGDCITIDNILKNKHVDFIKMDIEGAEIKALEGAKKTLTYQNIDIAVCTYHYPEDYERIYKLLNLYGYDDISN